MRKKIKKQNKKVALVEKEAVTIDSLEDQRSLKSIKDTALEKVKSITDKELRKTIIDKLTDPSAVGKNPMDLANEIIKEEELAYSRDLEDLEKERDDLLKIKRLIKLLESYDEDLIRELNQLNSQFK